MAENTTDSLPCWVYRSAKVSECYLYLAEKGGLHRLPDVLRRSLGRLELVMELELTPQRRLAREDVGRVLENLREQGFHLQMPPQNHLKRCHGE